MPHPNAARLRGLMTAILTPFKADGSLALDQMPALLRFQQEAGIDGVVVCGTNGEGTSLSIDERKRTLETVLANRGSLLVVAATGAASLPDALELTRHAGEVRADGALILPPFFYKNVSDTGVADHFRPLLDAADLPVLLYNIPQHSGVPITNSVLDALGDHANLSGVKDSAGDWTRTRELITRYPDLQIFAGSDRLAASCFAGGGAGGISGGANVFPEVIAAVRNAVRHDPQGAGGQEAQNRVNALLDITARYPFIAVSKSVLARRGLTRLAVRPPLANLTPEQEAALFSELTMAGFLPAV